MAVPRRTLALAAIMLALGATLGALVSPLAGGASERPAPAALAAATTPVAAPAAAAGATTRTVSVAGEGRVTVAYDLATVTFGVETSDAELAPAQAENARRTAALLDRLKALGIAEKDLQTVGYNVSPQYGDNGARLTGYRVVNGVRATVRDLGRLGATIDAAVAAGANRVHGIGFDLSNKEDATRRAREAAVADARGKAEQYARLTGLQLGAPVTIVEGGGDAPKYREAAPRAAGAMADAVTPIEPGQGAVTLTVQIVYELR